MSCGGLGKRWLGALVCAASILLLAVGTAGADDKLLEELKARAAKSGRPAKKSEVLRAGLKALAALSDSALAAALAQVPAIKTGRPAKA